MAQTLQEIKSKLQKLYRLRDHPNTGAGERQAAQARIEVLERRLKANASPLRQSKVNPNKYTIDFSSVRCTKRQYNFIVAICKYFHLEVPDKDITYDEAREVLNEWAPKFKLHRMMDSFINNWARSEW